MALFIERAVVRRDTSLPAVEYLKASQVDLLGMVIRQNLLANGSPLTKIYLNILGDEIVIEENNHDYQRQLCVFGGSNAANKTRHLEYPDLGCSA